MVDIYIPTLHTFAMGNLFTGSWKELRFRAEPVIVKLETKEVDFSQSAIRDYLLDRFKTMGENRQIIMVTHNPQFVVNLDVDNLIFMSKSDGTLKVQSGALEYTCEDYSVLEIVAQNIDFEKRYEFKGANAIDAFPDYMGARIDHHKDAEEMLLHYFIFNELKGTLSDPNKANKKGKKKSVILG